MSKETNQAISGVSEQIGEMTEDIPVLGLVPAAKELSTGGPLCLRLQVDPTNRTNQTSNTPAFGDLAVSSLSW